MECCVPKGGLVRLDGGKAGMTLRCTSGLVWLTRGDGMDYLVAPGRSFELASGERALAEALQPSELQLGEPASQKLKAVIGLVAC